MYKFFYFLIFICVFSSFISANESQINNDNLTFSSIDLENQTIDAETYYEFIRGSIITQPEFLYANSNYIEKDEQLKFTKRQRWPDLSVRIINDHVLDRDVSEFNSLRKRQDDSFDAAIELSQPIYSGGTINAQIRKAFSDKKLSSTEKQNALSILILDANEIYLNAVKSNTLYEYGFKLVKEIEPYLDKVKERVTLGISDPIELALFSIKFNALKSKVQILKTSRNRDIGIFEYFFGQNYKNNSFPNIFVPSLEMNKKIESYNVKGARLFLESTKEDTNIVKGEFRPQFGFNTRYTVYDLDEKENDTDVRGGIFFSMPIFTFGRASAKIAASKAKENATRVSIDIERKEDDVKENDIVNIVQSSANTRNEILNSYRDTKNQRRIIKNRLDSTSFSAESYVNSVLEELNLLEKFLSVEINLLHGYFKYLHQNQGLNSHIRIKP
jgi:outer membrane protein TolC